MIRSRLLLGSLLTAAACRSESGRNPPAADGPGRAPRTDDPPVAVDPAPPVDYPTALARERQGGTVVLRLFVDSSGNVAPDSTSIQESSGYPPLDSAAVAAAPRLRFAPAIRGGKPIGTAFLQPITFRPPPATDSQ